MSWLQLGVTVLASAGVASIIAQLLGARHERAQWLRDRNLDAADRYLQSILTVQREMLGVLPGDPLPDGLIDRALLSNQSLLILMAPRPVIEAAKAVSEAFTKWVAIQPGGTEGQVVAAFMQFSDRIADFSAAARSDLRTGKRDNTEPSRWPTRNR